MLILHFAVFPPFCQNDLLMHMSLVVYIDYNSNIRPFLPFGNFFDMPKQLDIQKSHFLCFLLLVNVMGEREVV